MIVFPDDNLSDWLELPEVRVLSILQFFIFLQKRNLSLTMYTQNIKDGIEGRPVSWYSEVFDLVFPDLDKEKANKCLICEWKKTHGGKEAESGNDD